MSLINGMGILFQRDFFIIQKQTNIMPESHVYFAWLNHPG